MIVDFHTHAFPDTLAKRALGVLMDDGHGIYQPCTDGTIDGLISRMDDFGVDVSVIQPIVTKPSQTENLNRWAKSAESDRIVAFGGIHPDCEDVEAKLDYIKSLGLKGIKLHPAYQRCYINDPRYLRIAEHCLKIGLYMVFHSGYDIAYPDYTPCTPKLFAETFAPLLEKYGEKGHPHVILAHLGGVMELDETMKYLIGLPIYLDTAYTLEQVDTETIMAIINAHGADKILFATDSPWQDQGACAKRFASLHLTDEQRELISHKNAEKILGI